MTAKDTAHNCQGCALQQGYVEGIAEIQEPVEAQLRARIAELEEQVNFLAANYIGPDFQYGVPAREAIVIKMPRGVKYSGDFRLDVQAALAAQAKQVEQAND